MGTYTYDTSDIRRLLAAPLIAKPASAALLWCLTKPAATETEKKWESYLDVHHS